MRELCLYLGDGFKAVSVLFLGNGRIGHRLIFVEVDFNHIYIYILHVFICMT